MSDTKFIYAYELRAGDKLSDGNEIQETTIPKDPRAADEIIIKYVNEKSFYCNRFEKFSVKK